MSHFAMKWQLQADNLLQSDNEEQQNFAKLLIGRAEGLFNMSEKEELWDPVTDFV